MDILPQLILNSLIAGAIYTLMDEGKLLVEGEPKEVLEKKEVIEVYLGK